MTLIVTIYAIVTLMDALRAYLRARLVRGALAPEDGEQPVLQLGGNLDVAELPGGVDRAAVGVDERDARGTALDVPLEELTRLAGEGPLEVIAQELGDLPALER